jgi:predicted deacetylase
VLDRHLLLAVHDVTPAHAAQLDRVFALLAEFDVKQVALLVVPDWHGDWPLAQAGAFTDRLRALRNDGAEVLLHGLRHDEEGSQRTMTQHVRAWGRTAGEAEFLSLSPSEASRRVDDGLAMLAAERLDPVGFVPPAWFHGEGLGEVLTARGFRVTEDAWSVIDLASGRRLRAPAVQWSARTQWRAAAGVAIAATRVPLERLRYLLRLVIHPPDIDVPMLADSVRRSLEALLRDRRPVSYLDVIAA